MLYKVAEGAVKETHYGLQIARVVPFPPGLVDRATEVAQKLERRSQRRKKTSVAVIRERRRKLILNLKEHLVQAHNSVMEGDVLAAWLRELQREFVKRMTAIEEEAARAELPTDSEGENEDEDMNEGNAEDLVEQPIEDQEDVVMTEGLPSTPTRRRERSAITVSSRMSSEELESASSVRAVSENEA
jgi:DNA mismatch repair protein MSH4